MQEGLTPEKVSYSWIEIVPMLAVLIFVVVALAVLPNCLDNSNCVELQSGVYVDLDKLSEELSRSENLFNNTNVEKP